jgi:hypothetical protein
MKIDGSCYCGLLTYEAEVAPNPVFLCHCTDCQILSGSPYRALVMTKAEHFKLSGTPKIYIKTAESGKKRAQAFCAECGTQIYASDVKDPGWYTLRFGAIKQYRELGAPTRQIWCDSALPWAMNIEHTPKAARQK